MKFYITYILILLFISGTCVAQEKTHEQSIIKYVNAYAENPSKTNAEKALKVIPVVQSDSVGRIYSDRLTDNLEKQILNNDPSALKLAIRLINIADGAFALDLYVIIVDITTQNPALLLNVLKNESEQHSIEGVLLNMSEPGLNQCNVWLQRKQSLQTVQDSDLRKIKEKAISVLNTEIKKCTQQGN